jgi:hypothetical protein
LSAKAAIREYIIAGTYMKDPDQFRQMLIRPEQKQAALLWSSTKATAHLLPTHYLDAELGGELETIMRRIKTLRRGGCYQLRDRGASPGRN